MQFIAVSKLADIVFSCNTSKISGYIYCPSTFQSFKQKQIKIYIYRTWNLIFVTIIQQVYFWYLISSIAQYVDKQKQQVKTDKPPYISKTVIEISRKRTKEKVQQKQIIVRKTNGTTKYHKAIPFNYTSGVTDIQNRIEHRTAGKGTIPVSVPLAWKIALYLHLI